MVILQLQIQNHVHVSKLATNYILYHQNVFVLSLTKYTKDSIKYYDEVYDMLDASHIPYIKKYKYTTHVFCITLHVFNYYYSKDIKTLQKKKLISNFFAQK